ncbi:hypothetical protein FIBSPDRAFT_924328 [Athelia psychrophila]|uniref:Uncharacterized protein n=1 Tax=Athelia psychrophila TaxID=1759441 RepID=A0A166WPV0_9AGAM|nr:hypothetical protein FIBSPDRAFT_924328 [Fibularhizoctonia sp. CBS 109695]
MPFAVLLVSLSLLQGCIAPAVNDIANAAPPLLEATRSFTSSGSTSDVCNNLSGCRSLDGIIVSCLTTISACILVAVHPNISTPAPRGEMKFYSMLHADSWIGLLLASWVEAIKAVGTSLLVPEWVLALAVRQFLQARYCAGILEQARVEAAVEAADEAITQNNRNKTQEGQLSHLRQLEFELRRNNRSWTTTHAFFINMGGFHSYRNGNPMFPLAYEDVLARVKSRSLFPPTLDELRDNSKGDALSKSIAVFQTLWFVVQCIARHIENRAITNLEIMTLAYTVITVAMYAAWWNKPLNVRYPIRVLVQGGKEEVSAKRTPTFERSGIIGYVRRNEDRLVILLSGEAIFLSGIIGLALAMVFGAIHCAAWSFAFPSLAEQRVWRVCAIAIVAIPLALTVALVVFMVFNPGPPVPFNQAQPLPTGHSAYTYHIPLICMYLCAFMYIPARIFLLGLSFSTLRHLPLSAYQTIQWTTFIPHI